MSGKLVLRRVSWPIVRPLISYTGSPMDGSEFEILAFEQNMGEINARLMPENQAGGKPVIYEVSLKISPMGELQSSHCSCTTKVSPQYPLCIHRAAALAHIASDYGEDYLSSMFSDYSDEKNRLLAEYGLTLETYSPRDFNFLIRQGAVQLKPLNPAIQKVATTPQAWFALRQTAEVPATELSSEASTALDWDNRVMLFGITLHGFGSRVPLMQIEAFSAAVNKAGRYIALRRIEDNALRGQEIPVSSSDDQAVLQTGKMLEWKEFVKRAHKVNAVPGEQLLYDKFSDLAPGDAAGVSMLERNAIERIWHSLSQAQGRIFLNRQGGVVAKVEEMEMLTLSQRILQPRFVVQEEGGNLVLGASLPFEVEDVWLHEYTGMHSLWLWEHSNILYRMASLESGMLLRMLVAHGGRIMVQRKGIDGFLEHLIVPLTSQHPIEFDLQYPMAVTPWILLGRRIYLKESETGLRFVPAFVYDDGSPDGVEVPNNGGRSRATWAEGTIQILRRDEIAEQQFIDLIQSMNPLFSAVGSAPEYHLLADDLLRDGWFFTFTEAMRENKVEVLGFGSLKKFRYNPNRAFTRVQVTSGIDWFDLKITLSFGDQVVALADVKKAIANRKNYVVLADGTLGLLPEEWLKRYGEVLKMAQVRGEHVKISKRHFMLLELMREEIDEVDVLKELEEKRYKLLNFREIPDVPVPDSVHAVMRQYQTEGYKWLHFLDEFGWGGILADDMGLGKTLQVLAFLSEIKFRHPESMHLIVLPKSLIFNWQAEVEKFCPHLRTLAYHGTDRWKLADTFKDYDLILTTYGTMRSDISDLQKIKFHYVVLDESQAIKNPSSQVAQAVRLLKAKNRLAMTGTPIENNTFDLWSQFEFLNPGFLGSADFFREEFANPIDRFQDKEKAAGLRKLVYPFMLKRTKEEVATDLPEKVESVIYCEMNETQRKVYDYFREKYRVMLAEKMAKEGREKSAFLILEGLLKLRQICDSPALLNDDSEYPDDSVKLDEIVREIQENTSNHKILIFSQFVGMLSLVRKHLEKEAISYEYLDGQTQNRAERVARFQTDDTVRVFLMSLKAGGVGLNLTGADYVYLIDPWWNPAVEAQAIDRTHRIGQTKSVFAYRMICKDTVEEKIMKLQEKKQEIAGDVIDAESGFLKSLSQEDVMGLFM